ncbi:hypothetical protein BBJ28_00005241 [Nothophytophthora sp. Chile5]|nr:hypothetical protein BBJ28_00005241 [Nothophytophthora sp. Chile5]
MEVEYDGQTAFDAAANGDFPLVVLLWGMAMAVQPRPVDLLAAVDRDGNTLAHYAAAGGTDTLDTMHFLMQQMQASGREQTLLDARNAAGETPLIRAAHAGNIRLADTLLRSGFVDLLAKDARGNTAAQHAAAQGHLWVLHFLLEAEQRQKIAASSAQQPVQPTTLGGYCLQRRNVLHYACMGEYKPMVQYLLARGFDADEADAKGTTCLDLAKSRHLPWLQELLTDKKKVGDPPTQMRKTRGIVAVLHGALLLAILATSYWLVWWLSLPLILVVLWKSLAAFRQPHRHGGHAHGAAVPTKNLESVHPSKRGVSVTPNVSLARLSEGPAAASSPRRSSKAKAKKASSGSGVGLRTLRKAQPETAMGIWMAWVGLFTLLYVVLWADPTYKSFSKSYVVFLGIVGGLEVAFLLTWLRLAFVCPSDPGTISTYEEDVKAMLDQAAQAEAPNMTKFCRTCLVLKPIRSKHCSQCGVCVARLDHHCAWINRCVGYGNHRIFVAFLLLHCLVLVAFAALAVLVLYEATLDLHAERISSESSASASGDEALTAMGVWMEVPSLVSKHLLVVMVLLWSLMAFVALAMMLHQHVNNLEQNLTINEQMNWRRYPYLTKPAASGASTNGGNKQPEPSGAKLTLSNPFDRGFRRNVAEFFTRSGSSAVDYHQVFSLPPWDSDVASPTTTAVDMGAVEGKKQVQQTSSEEIDLHSHSVEIV